MYAFSYTYNIAPSNTYPDPSLAKLKDGQKVTANDSAYVGFQNLPNSMVELLNVDLIEDHYIGTFKVYYVNGNQGTVFSPLAFGLSTSLDGVTYSAETLFTPSSSDPIWPGGDWGDTRAAAIPVNDTARYLKLRVQTGGQWLMLSELDPWPVFPITTENLGTTFAGNAAAFPIHPRPVAFLTLKAGSTKKSYHRRPYMGKNLLSGFEPLNNTLKGVVKLKASPTEDPVPYANALVQLFVRRSGYKVASAISDANGNFEFLHVAEMTEGYYIIAFDSLGNPAQNAVILDRLSSV